MKKVVLVTGASRGIGAAIAKKFGGAGWTVAINYSKSEQAAKEVQRQIIEGGSDASLFCCDIADECAAKEMVQEVAEKFGRIDVLINNAGICIEKPLDEKTSEEFLKTLHINLIAPFVLSVKAAQIMGKKGGCIINIGSTSATLNNASTCDYDASKAAICTLTNNLAMFFQPNVRVNTVSPGFVKTDMSADIDEKTVDVYRKKIADAEDIAEVVFFLASDAARHINAANIVVNGGGLN